MADLAIAEAWGSLGGWLEVQDRLLDVGREVSEIEDLHDSGAGDAGRPSDLGLVFDLAGGEQVLQSDRKRAIRHVIYGTNWWKSFSHARLAVAMGDRGCLSVFGDRPEMHRMFAEQVTAEYFVRTEGRGRTVDEWKARPEQPDNHWLDCLVGTAVAASMQGALLFGTDLPAQPKRPRVSFKELQRAKRN